MSRPEKCRRICSKPAVCTFAPTEGKTKETVILGYDEYEVIRLIDYENMSQFACAEKMGISRPTATRVYRNARRKLAAFLMGGKTLKIEGGDVMVCTKMRPECQNAVNCCHRER